jgi:hypothetical protein
MDATIMPTSDLLPNIISQFPQLSFVVGEEFRWSPQKKTITYNLEDPHLTARLLHEVAHAELGHHEYERDIELIAYERDAWHYAKATLSPLFGVIIDSDTIEDDLDTYRDWLHARSTCPECSATGIQTNEKEYTCVACRTVWTVNQAIGCGLKRHTKKHP